MTESIIQSLEYEDDRHQVLTIVHKGHIHLNSGHITIIMDRMMAERIASLLDIAVMDHRTIEAEAAEIRPIQPIQWQALRAIDAEQ